MSKEALEALELIHLHPPSTAKKAVLRLLAWYHNRKTGCAYPGIERMARELGCGRSTVIEHLNDLCQSKPPAVVRERNKGGRSLTTHYILPWVDYYMRLNLVNKVTSDTAIHIKWTSSKSRRKSHAESKQSGNSDCINPENSTEIPGEQSGNWDRLDGGNGTEIRSKGSGNTAQSVRRSGLEKRLDYKRANAAYWRSFKPNGSKGDPPDGSPWEPDQ